MSINQTGLGPNKPEETVVHNWSDGRSACPISEKHGAPVTWPSGNSYSRRWEDVTCQDCLALKPSEDAGA